MSPDLIDVPTEAVSDMPIASRHIGANGQSVKRRKKPVVLGVLAVLAIIGGTIAVLWAIHEAHFESTDDAFIEGRVIPISPQLPARVQAVHVSDNQTVHKGDLLVELDPTDYQVALDQAKASESAVVGQLQQAKAQVTASQASQLEAEAELSMTQANAASVNADYQRYQKLSGGSPGAVSKQQMDSIEASQQTATAQIAQAKAKIAQAQADFETAQANVVAAQGNLAKAQADIRRAEVNLSYCTIVAPEDGRVTRKNVEPGSYVQAGQNVLALVPPDVWVVANFKETELTRMRVGQPVSIEVDAYPGQEFTGKIQSIQSGTGSRFSMLPTENATGNFVHVVQRVPVKIILDSSQSDSDHPLVPGMSVEPQVRLD
jgi:membrane fusion protein, multidrug efflux system